MKIQRLHPLWTLGLMGIHLWMSGCAYVRSGTSNPVALTGGTFNAINAGSAAVTLTANQNVHWALTLGTQACAPGCGTLTPSTLASMTATYTPPMAVPSYGTATIIATANNDNTTQFVFSFRIVGPIQVNIATSKFQSALAGSAPIPIAAAISNDVGNKGLAWTLTVGGSNCSPTCGNLSVSAAPSLTAIYTPPPTAPTGAADTPTIQVSSVTRPQASDSISFSILPAIVVAITSAKFTSVLVGSAAVNITASITNDPANAGLTWSLTAGGSVCSPSCGTLAPASSPSLTAVYTPPATLPASPNSSPTITVNSVTNPLANDSIAFSVVPIITVSITSPKFKSTSAGAAPITVFASIVNDVTGKGLNWTLTAGGSPCSPGCGTVLGQTMQTAGGVAYSGLYTPPTAVPSSANDNPTITVSSVANPSAQDSFSFTIVTSSNLFSGSYAFLMRGYDTSGGPLSMAGTLSADGAGNITGGEIDINDNGGTLFVQGPLVGIYTIDLSFQNVTRGIITIANFTFPGTSTGIAFRFTLSADGTRGRIIEMDGAGYRQAGTILKQDATALAAANPSGSYAFGLDADAPAGQGGRAVEDGQFVLGSTGNVISGLADLSRAAALLPIFTDQALDPVNGTPPDASGRGQMTLSLQGNQAKYAYYIVNTGQLYLIEIDHGWADATVQAGTAQLQHITADSVNMTSVIQMTGIDVSPASGGPSCEPANSIGPHVLIGVVNISGGNTFQIGLQYNDLGCLGHSWIPDTSISGSIPGVVAFDPSTGRGTITIYFGYDQAFVNQAVFYLYGPGTGFIIDADPSPNNLTGALTVTNQGYSGTLVPQVSPQIGIPFSGNLLMFSGSSSTPDIPEAEGAVNVISPTNTVLAGEASFALQMSSVSVGNIPDVSIPVPDSKSGIPANSLGGAPQPTLFDPINMASLNALPFDAGFGHEEVPQALFGVITNGYLPLASYIYTIGPNQFVAIGNVNTFNTAPPQISHEFSGVMFFDPE